MLQILEAFESLVNTEGIQTSRHFTDSYQQFESLVNTEGIQTMLFQCINTIQFESLVNTEGIQTYRYRKSRKGCLRVLLIRKEFKPV